MENQQQNGLACSPKCTRRAKGKEKKRYKMFSLACYNILKIVFPFYRYFFKITWTHNTMAKAVCLFCLGPIRFQFCTNICSICSFGFDRCQYGTKHSSRIGGSGRIPATGYRVDSTGRMSSHSGAVRHLSKIPSFSKCSTMVSQPQTSHKEKIYQEIGEKNRKINKLFVEECYFL